MGPGLFLILMILLVILPLAAELGIQGLNRWPANCLEKSEKRGVQADKTPRGRAGNVGSALSWGIHGQKSRAATCLEKSEKRGEIAVFPTAEQFSSSGEI